MKLTTFLFLVLAVVRQSGAQVVEKVTLTSMGAKQVVSAVVMEAKKRSAGAAIAVVDDGGHLLAFERLDGTFAAGAEVSIGKAKTSALFKKPTKFFEDVIAKGRTAMVALPEFTPLQGGVPILVNGVVVGAVGVSGAHSAAEDEELALVGAQSVSMKGGLDGDVVRSAPVTFLEQQKVTAAFRMGAPLLETQEFKIHASHRTGPGQTEVHEHETDIVYVVAGSAVVVTGGEVIEGRKTGEGEIRGVRIEKGQETDLKPGDVLVIPAGVPHWFREVNGTFDYYVVKVIR